jgi:hypothetical protein
MWLDLAYTAPINPLGVSRFTSAVAITCLEGPDGEMLQASKLYPQISSCKILEESRRGMKRVGQSHRDHRSWLITFEFFQVSLASLYYVDQATFIRQ